jgi:hypothetical protein
MNPFLDPAAKAASEAFYTKFYSDTRKRKLILGINPGRHGAGTTGIPFTDTKRLEEICGIRLDTARTHEPSSVFVYNVIANYGGPDKFYRDFLISAICPLGFLRLNSRNNWVNCNYYEKDIWPVAKPFIVSCLKQQIAFGIDTDHCTILGRENARYFDVINAEEKLFRSYTILEHPRYIEQYKKKSIREYVKKYIDELSSKHTAREKG